MIFILMIFSIFIALKSFSYALYEIKNNNNKFGGFFVIIISIVILFLPSYMVYIR